MFGVLNRFISSLDSEPREQEPGSHGSYGFQVLKNTQPEVSLEPYFDFIVGINGRVIDNPDNNLFTTEVRNSAGSTISLGVWSAKGRSIRELYLPIPADSPALGLSLQWCPLSVSDDVWHILDVIPESPADLAGLLPYGDYIIGSPEGLMRGENGLSELVEDYLDRPLRLYVYNHEYDVTRPLTITPTRSWGGSGALGCVLGFGALHRIPTPLDEAPQAPGETLFDSSNTPTGGDSASGPVNPSGTVTARPATQFLVPADIKFNPSASPPLGTSATNATTTMPPPPQASGAQLKSARKPRMHHQLAAVAGTMDDLLEEGEKKSRDEEERGDSRQRKIALPPPPTGAAAAALRDGPPKDPVNSAGKKDTEAEPSPPAKENVYSS